MDTIQMSWLVAGLLAPFLWAVTNLLDQEVIRKYFPNQILLLVVINYLFQIIPFAIISIYKPEIFNTEPQVIIIFISTALINTLAFFSYYKVIEKDEATNATPVLQIQPIIIFIAAYFLFGEEINIPQAIGASLIIVGSICLMIDFEKKILNWKTLMLMSFCASILAGTTVIDRYLFQTNDWDTGLAWKSIGYVIFAIAILAMRPSILKQTITKFKTPLISGLHFILGVEFLATLGTACFLLSLAQAPSAGLTQTLTGFITFFVLILSYVAYKLSPSFFSKPKKGLHLGWHIVCLVTMFGGLWLIYNNV